MRKRDSDILDIIQLKKTLFQTLGYYDLDDKTHVIIPSDRYNGQVESTIYHENTHLYLFSCTSFGLFQKLLGLLQSRGAYLPKAIRDRVDRLLDYSLSESLLVHEGVATFCQIAYLANKLSPTAASEYLSNKPERYQAGCSRIKAIVESLSLPFLDVDDAAKAVCESVLNTSILEHSTVVYEDDESILLRMIREESPNERLNRLWSSLTHAETLRMLRSNIITAATDAFGDVCSTSGRIPYEERHVAYSAIMKSIDATIFPVYGSGDSHFILRRLKAVTSKLRHRAHELGLTELADLEFIVVPREETVEYEGNVEFRPGKPPDKEIAAIDCLLQKHEALKMLEEYSLHNEGRHLLYFHVLEPFIGTERTRGATLVHCGPGDEIIIVDDYDMAANQRLGKQMILRIKSTDVVSLAIDAASRNAVLVSSLHYFDATQPEYLKRKRSILQDINKECRIHYYLPRTTLDFLKSISEQLLRDAKVTVLQSYAQHLDLCFLFLLLEPTNSVWFAPIGRLTLSRFLTWGMHTLQDFVIASEDFQADFFERGPGILLLDHYYKFGY